jgi:cysteine-rich repeat protein
MVMGGIARIGLLVALFVAAGASPRAALAVCGDGVLEPDTEQCDDGNTARGDGCNAECQVRLCLEPPPQDCVVASDATLRIKQRGKDDKVKAKIDLRIAGFSEDVSLADLGDPVFGTTRYDVCIYDQDDRVNGLFIVARGFGVCGKKRKACWKQVGSDGYRYTDPDGASNGVQTIDLVAGRPGGARVFGKRNAKLRDLPLVSGALVTGALLTFARSIGEFGSTIMVSGNLAMKTQTAPLYIFTKFNEGDVEGANAIAVVLAVISFAVFSLIILFRNRLER